MAGTESYVDAKILQRPVVVFSKIYSPDCNFVKKVLAEYGLSKRVLEYVEIEGRQDCTQIENYLQVICLTDDREVPQLFVNGTYVGGEKEILLKHESGELKDMLSNLQTDAH